MYRAAWWMSSLKPAFFAIKIDGAENFSDILGRMESINQVLIKSSNQAFHLGDE